MIESNNSARAFPASLSLSQPPFSRFLSLSLWPSFISLVGGARRIIGRDAVGRNAGAFVYGTRANATLILLSSYSSRAVPSLSISLQAVWDAQIKGDSVRAESPFRMERLSALSLPLLLLLLLRLFLLPLLVVAFILCIYTSTGRLPAREVRNARKRSSEVY